MKAVVGIDYGTQSGRAILVDAENGHVLREHSIPYPHGVIADGLASAEDYETVLLQLLENVLTEEYRDSVLSICVDATSLTIVPVDRNGVVLCHRAAFADRKHAQIKLWKYHGAQAQADEALNLAKIMDEPFIRRTGGSLSSEWMLPKVLQIRDEDPEVYAEMDMALDLCEYLTFRLTGTVTRSKSAMGFKGQWVEDLGFPSDNYLNTLRPGFAAEFKNLMRGPILRACDVAGTLLPELARRLGLRENVVVASGVIDGHTSMAALGAMKEGDGTIVVGTSNVIAIQGTRMQEIPDICGVVKDGMIPDTYAIEAGQNCTGDMLEWYMNNMLPYGIWQQAQERKVSPHQVLLEMIEEPWKNTLAIADWWNGSRCAPSDLKLRGAMSGLSLTTRPQDIYLALLQAIVCGTRTQLELCEKYGITVTRIVATGGMTAKNPILMQQYASILNQKIYVGQVKEGPALGTAIFAAVAAGIYSTTEEAYEAMGVHDFTVYEPDTEHRTEYEIIYRNNRRLRTLLVENRP